MQSSQNWTPVKFIMPHEKNSRQRQSAKAEFQKKYTNPLKGVSGGGYIVRKSSSRFNFKMKMKINLNSNLMSSFQTYSY